MELCWECFENFQELKECNQCGFDYCAEHLKNHEDCEFNTKWNDRGKEKDISICYCENRFGNVRKCLCANETHIVCDFCVMSDICCCCNKQFACSSNLKLYMYICNDCYSSL